MFVVLFSTFLSFLVLQLCHWERESWLLNCLGVLNVMYLLLLLASSSWCHVLVCSIFLRYFLVKLNNFMTLLAGTEQCYIILDVHYEIGSPSLSINMILCSPPLIQFAKSMLNDF